MEKFTLIGEFIKVTQINRSTAEGRVVYQDSYVIALENGENIPFYYIHTTENLYATALVEDKEREKASKKLFDAWRATSGGIATGYYMWEVYEVFGSLIREDALKYYFKTRDGGFIYAACSHYWTEKEMLDSASFLAFDLDLNTLAVIK